MNMQLGIARVRHAICTHNCLLRLIVDKKLKYVSRSKNEILIEVPIDRAQGVPGNTKRKKKQLHP